MKFSLVSREIIADSVEAVVQGHAYDAIVGFGGCDKSLPGMMIGDDPLQCAGGVHVWRERPAGAVAWAGRDDP